MRKLIALIVFIALLWGGYWMIARSGLETALDAGTQAARQQGWGLEYSDRRTRGFPSRLDTSFSALSVTTPDRHVTWAAPFFQVLALSYRPNHLIAVWPQQQTLDTPAGRYRLNSTDMRASAVFQPDSEIAFEHGNLVVEAPSLDLPAGISLGAQSLRAALRQLNNDPARQKLGFELTGFDIPADWMTALGIPATAPNQLTLLRITADLTFARPLDRQGTAHGMPPVSQLAFKTAQLTWDDMTINLTGELTPDASGFLSGTATLRATQWSRILSLMPLSPEDRSKLGAALGAVSADGETLEIPIRMSEGTMFAAGLPVGPAPYLQLPY